MIESKTPLDTVNSAHIHAPAHLTRSSVLKVGRFILHLLEMLLSMVAGMPLFFLLGSLIPDSSNFAAAFESGTSLYDLAHAAFMTLPMVTWMVIRRHGLRHSAEMAFAMLAPVAASIGLSLVVADAYRPFLSDASHLAMLFGMLIAMVYRRDHYTGKSAHSAHAHSGGILSHPAIVAREYRIPAVVATGNATKLVRDGQIVIVDGDIGIMEIVEGENQWR